ncbi:hypothetical protein KCP73_05970 [Salmonella enterica subsp. enterica]|nr:hypothetical protein KCP73_05970 [Salmonella enterica subsp. enterica]
MTRTTWDKDILHQRYPQQVVMKLIPVTGRRQQPSRQRDGVLGAVV